MVLKSLFPVFITPAVKPSRDFYVRNFGFRVVFEADWYVQLHASRPGNTPPLELAFMSPGAPAQPSPLHAAFSGAGVILTIDVEDVDAVRRRLQSIGALTEVVVDLRDEPWGQRHFLFRDPAGILVDVVQLIPPSAEYVGAYTGQ